MVLAVDIAGAFDKVSHIGVTYKLQTLEVRGRALTWLTDYLSLRKLQAVVNGQSSSPYPIESGVPQGSILGPTLFLIYVNDAEQCLAPGCSLATFADDTSSTPVLDRRNCSQTVRKAYKPPWMRSMTGARSGGSGLSPQSHSS